MKYQFLTNALLLAFALAFIFAASATIYLKLTGQEAIAACEMGGKP